MEWKIECDELSANGLTVKGIRIYSNSTEKETLASLDTLKYGAELFAKIQLEYDKIDKIVKDVKSNEVVEKIKTAQEKFKEANRNLNEYFDKCAYERLVYKLKTNDIFYYRMKDFFSERKFIKDVEACVESGQMLFKVKRVLRYLMQHFMCVPEFVFGNMGKIYDNSEDKGNDKLCGYLKMIWNYFFKKSKSSEVIDCVEMSKRIYGLLLDAIDEASSIYRTKNDEYEEDNWL